MRREIISLGITLALTVVVFASVFVYYPLTVTATPTPPSVVFQPGSNAGQPDIGPGNTISVSIGANSTSASITIHPTYQENYYKNVTLIVNYDSKAYNVYIVFTSVSNNLPAGSVVTLFVYSGNTLVKAIDITSPSTNTPISIGSLPAGSKWELDFYVKIPEGTNINGASYSVTAKLVFTPSSETPPANPSAGR